MRFEARVWETGNSKVVTIPPKLEAKKGDKFWVTLDPYEEEVSNNDSS